MQAARYTTVLQALAYRAQHSPDLAAFIFRDRAGRRSHVITFDQWHRLAGRYAAVLRKKGVTKGSKVLNTLPNSPERVVCEFGALYAGATTVNSQCLLTDGSDVMQHLRQSRCDVILLDPDVTNSPWAPLQLHARISDDGLVTSDELPDLKRVEVIRRRGNMHSSCGKEETEGEHFLAKLQADLDGEKDRFMADDVTADDVCTVFTTSGSTGFSKLVAHTHKNLVSLLELVTRAADLADKGDPVVVYLNNSLGWYGGYPSTFLLMRRTRVLCDHRDGTPDDMPAFIARCVREENCSSASLQPFYISVLLERRKKAKENGIVSSENEIVSGTANIGIGTNGKERVTRKEEKNPEQHHQYPKEDEQENCFPNDTERDDGRNLEWKQGQLSDISVMGQPVPRAVVKQALTLASRVMVVYASTEMGPVSQVTVTSATVDQYPDYFVGHLFPGIQARVVDESDEDRPLPDGQTGHLLIKNPYGFIEYLNDPEATIAAFTHDGFFRTGDRAQLSSDDKGKTLTVFCRMGDAITKGDIIIYPEWIEARLSTCPGVVSAIVVGVPDEKTGRNEMCACLMLEDGVGVQHVREHIEKEMVAESVNFLSTRPAHYLRFAEFPLLYTKRPNRRLIKEMACQQVKGSNHA